MIDHPGDALQCRVASDNLPSTFVNKFPYIPTFTYYMHAAMQERSLLLLLLLLLLLPRMHICLLER